jgi:hypothetical protein
MSHIEKALPVEVLRTLVRLDSGTGKLYWLRRNSSERQPLCEAWNAKWEGKEAFISKRIGGYLYGHIGDVKFLAHRVVYAVHHGFWPFEQIDHINRDRSDNRVINLRPANSSQNGQNKSLLSNNTSGFVGVTKRRGRWGAQIMLRGSTVRLGHFDTPQEASVAYLSAKREMHPFYIDEKEPVAA